VVETQSLNPWFPLSQYKVLLEYSYTHRHNKWQFYCENHASRKNDALQTNGTNAVKSGFVNGNTQAKEKKK